MGMPERLAFILVKNHPFTPLSLFPNTNQKRIQVSTKKIKLRHVREGRLQMNECTLVLAPALCVVFAVYLV